MFFFSSLFTGKFLKEMWSQRASFNFLCVSTISFAFILLSILLVLSFYSWILIVFFSSLPSSLLIFLLSFLLCLSYLYSSSLSFPTILPSFIISLYPSLLCIFSLSPSPFIPYLLSSHLSLDHHPPLPFFKRKREKSD